MLCAMSADGTSTAAPAGHVRSEAARRRTIAVISHPDAGKTTLTEHLVKAFGAIEEAGMVRAKRGRAGTVTDWMALEQERGISITSSAVRLDVDGTIVNLLDTPGHGDFSEDTYRVLSAVDAAIMLLDAAKGIEPQTRRLFEVCRARNTPIITFINKFDRPARDPLELLDEVERTLELAACPLNWPIGDGDRFSGLVTLPGLEVHAFEGARHADDPELVEAATAGAELAWEAAGGFDGEAFLGGSHTPVLFGAAVRDQGVAELVEVLLRHAPPPQAMPTASGGAQPVDAGLSGFVFKLQSNMDPRHRDVSAFIRICSGRFARGDRVTVQRTGRSVVVNHAHEPFGRERATVDEAYPGDVIVVPGAAEMRIGDTIHAGDAVEFPRLKTYAPDIFRDVVNTDTSRRKQFQRGLEQLAGEGVVQLLVDPSVGMQRPVAAAVGQLQFEVFVHRMRDEFGVEVRLDPLPYKASAQTRTEDEPEVRSWPSVRVLQRANGTPLALFPTEWALRDRRERHPDVLLGDLLA